jgi:hypothetical protein
VLCRCHDCNHGRNCEKPHSNEKNLKGLQKINEGNTKVIRIGDNMDNLIPITNKVNFKYVTSFKLLGVTIDNKLEKLSDNFENCKN